VSKYGEYIVFYDHGDSRVESNVAETKGFFGHRVTNANQLASVDVMIANADKELIVLVEIEERELSPKKLLGDVFAILMCNGFAVKVGERQEYFTINSKTQLIVVGVVPPQGDRVEKINKVIRQRLEQFQAPSDAIAPRNVSLVFTGGILSSLEALKEKMRKLFSEKHGGAS